MTEPVVKQKPVFENLIFLQEQNQLMLTNFFRNFKKDGAARQTKVYFEKRLSTLEEYFSKIKSVHADLLKVLYEDEKKLSEDPYFKENEYSILEALYLQIYDSIQEAFLAKFPILTENVPPSSNLNTSASSHSERVVSNDFKMQKVQIPQFRGDYDSWLTFRDFLMQVCTRLT